MLNPLYDRLYNGERYSNPGFDRMELIGRLEVVGKGELTSLERSLLRDLHEIVRTVGDIHLQATRKERASGLKRYLETDLEIIARKAREILV